MQQAVRSDWDVRAQAARGRARRRRVRVAQRIVASALTTVVLCVVVIWQRNWVRLQEATERFEGHLTGLVETVKGTGVLPLVYPPPAAEKQPVSSPDFTYIDSAMVRHYRSSLEPVIVAYSPAVRLILGTDDRVVAIKEGNEVRVTVMRTDRFARRFAEQKREAQAALEAVREAGPKLP